MNKMPLMVITYMAIGGVFLSGCAVHRYEKSSKLDGYAVARFGYVIPEYTVDLENKAPQDLAVAKERFKRRNDIVESYYLRMGRIESYFRRYVWHFPMIMWSIFANTLKMPFHIVSEYRYGNNPAYREKIDNLDARQKEIEDARQDKLRLELREFVRKDLEKEEVILNAVVK